MLEIINKNESFEREVWDRKKAINYFKDQGEIYKTEIIKDIPNKDEISIYKQGKFLDLCKGPHSPSIEIAIADFDRLELIFFASSSPCIELEKFFFEPSGSFIETITIKL